MRSNQIKKILILLGSAVILSAINLSNVKAQDSTAYLKQIAENTLAIMQDVNDLPSYLQSASQLIQAWLNPDTSETTATIQGGFTELGNLLTQNMTGQTSLQTTLNTDLLNNNGNNVTNANLGKPMEASLANDKTLWYANDLVYSTLLGMPYFSKDPRAKEGQQGQEQNKVNAPYNYIKNASGINIFHPIPGISWNGNQAARLRYQNYFNTVTAVTSFNAYVLSDQYADGNQFNTLQTKLIQQATDPKAWFAQVASENVGFVLRQILLYQSQTFVLLTQMIQLQRQAVSAQAMTNAVLVAINQPDENVMIANAKGQPPM
jgi:hypothetical protein